LEIEFEGAPGKKESKSNTVITPPTKTPDKNLNICVVIYPIKRIRYCSNYS
jgi:hypothetical protein